ncbi:MAG: tetratricopeptide repeat protein, partial [Blastocatellia bacterium]
SEGDSYRLLHPIVREFALQKLSESGEDGNTKGRAADYFMKLAQDALGKLGTDAARAAIEKVGTYREDLVWALGWLAENRRWEETVDLGMALGQLLVNAGRLDLSIKGFESARRAAESLGDRRLLAAALHNLGTVYQYQGDYGTARSLFEESLRIKQELNDARSTAATLHQLGVLAQACANYAEAESLYRESLQIDEELGDMVGVSADLYELGSLSQSQRRYDEASGLYQRSLEISERIGNRRAGTQASQALGRVYLAQGRFDLAKLQFEQALEVFRRIGDRRGESGALANLGFVHSQAGDYVKALENYERALSIAREFSPAADIRVLLMREGNALAGLGYLDKAEEYLREARDLALDAPDTNDLVAILTGLGSLSLSRNNLEAGNDYLKEALTQARKIGNPDTVLPVLVHLGWSAHLVSDTVLAKHYLEEALAIARRSGDSKKILGVVQNLATVELNAGELQSAEEHAQEALRLAEHSGDAALTGFVAILGSKIAARKGDPAAAFRLIGKAIEIPGGLPYATKFSASSLHNYRDLSDHIRELRNELGGEGFEKGLKEAGLTIPDHLLEPQPEDAREHASLEYLVTLGRRHELANRWAAAIEAYQNAIEFFESGDSGFRQAQHADLKFHLGICLRNADRLREALAQQAGALDILGLSGDLKARADVLMEIALLQHLLNNYEEAWLRYLDSYRLYRRADNGAGYKLGMAAASEALGMLEFYARMLPQAIRDLEDARDIYLSLDLKGKSSLVEETLNAARQAQHEREASVSI